MKFRTSRRITVCRIYFYDGGVGYVWMGFTALETDLVLFARPRDLVMSFSVRTVRVVFSNAGFKDGGKPCPKTHETVALQ